MKIVLRKMGIPHGSYFSEKKAVLQLHLINIYEAHSKSKWNY
jgi:hypothetical protein